MAINDTPRYSASVKQAFLVEPSKSSSNTKLLIDAGWFPEGIYDTSPESVLSHFFDSLMGTSGVASLRKTFFEARMALEATHLQDLQLEKFYTDPLRFSKNITSTPFYEDYSEDPFGVLTRDQWNSLRAKDESYRNRAIDFLHAARLGGTVEGLKLAAKSATGYEFDLVENYQFMFDQHSDDVIGLDNYRDNKAAVEYDTNEFTLFPNQEVSRTLVYNLKFEEASIVSRGSLLLKFNGEKTTVNYSATNKITNLDIYTALSNFKSIGFGNVSVLGTFLDGFTISFFNNYSDRADKSFEVTSSLYSSADPINPKKAILSSSYSNNSSTEVAKVNQYDAHLIDLAIDRLKPVNSYGNYSTAGSIYTNQIISKIFASSSYHEVVYHVTGNNDIEWPAVDKTNWIESGTEKEAPRVKNDLQYHYQGFHSPVKTIAYGDNAIADGQYTTSFSHIANTAQYISEHRGDFNKAFVDTFVTVPYLQNRSGSVSKAVDALTDFAQPLDVTSRSDAYDTNYINGIYPVNDDLHSIISKVNNFTGNKTFWASSEDTHGSEYLELDFGGPRAVNFIAFEIFKLPIDIEIMYDQLSQGDQRSFKPIVPESNSMFIESVYFDATEKGLPWRYLSYNFTDKYGQIPFTRYIRIKFTRRSDQFLPLKSDKTNNPWPILVKNLRVGRNV